LSSDSTHLPQADFVGYLRKLEQVLIKALAQFGVVGEQVPGFTGVWVQSQSVDQLISLSADALLNWVKIAAIGVKVDVRGISRHGFALNVDPDMSYWDGIIGCGLEGYQETSLAELLDSTPSMATVSEIVGFAFEEIFEYSIEWQNTV
jgi:lipoate-protein ligase B